MKSEIVDLAYHRMKRAKEAFRDGELLLNQGSIWGAVGRFYYAAFYAARALLATRELDSSKHKGVILLFSKHFVKENIIFPETAKALSRSFEKRLDSDYEDYVEFSSEDVKAVSEEVLSFIEACQQALEKLLEKDANS